MGNSGSNADDSERRFRLLRLGALACVAFTLAGCSAKPEAYYEVMRENRATLREVTAILSDIHDEKSLAAAKIKLDAQLPEIEARAHRAKTLPTPPPAEVVARMSEEAPAMQQSVAEYQYQVKRVRDLKLKGGEAFFKHFKTSQSDLLSGVQP